MNTLPNLKKEHSERTVPVAWFYNKKIILTMETVLY